MATNNNSNTNTNTNNTGIKFSERTINDFRSKLVGGGARPNLFECELSFPAGLDVQLDESYRFMIKAAQIPGSTVSTIPVPFRGRTLKIAGDRTFDPWTITVINDTNYTIRDAFEKWMNYLNRHDDSAGVITPLAYQADMRVFHLARGTIANTSTESGLVTNDSTIPVLKVYKFYGCWPSDITPMDLSYDSSDTIQEFSVTLQYQWWDALSSDGATSILGTSETSVQLKDAEVPKKDPSEKSNSPKNPGATA